jgi:hypothetical protein
MRKKPLANSSPTRTRRGGGTSRSYQAQFNIDQFVNTIKERYRSWNAPVVTLVASHGGGPLQLFSLYAPKMK